SVAGALPPDTASDQLVTQTVRLDKDTPVKLDVNITGGFASQVDLQYSYFPISPDTTDTAPPGMFDQVTLALNDQGEGSTTFDPWKWRDAKATSAASTFDASGNNLSLSDQVAYDLAKANLAAHKDLIDTVYVRAVSTESPYEKTDGDTVLALASRSVEVDMKDTATYPTIDSAEALLIPGDDEHATDLATRSECFTVVDYPPAGTWISYPDEGPKTTVDFFGVTHTTSAGNPNESDQFLADTYWGTDKSVIHCLDPNADAERQADADAQSQADEDSCGILCFLEAVTIGAVVGFAFGGPVGALIGAGAGLVFAIADPSAVANLEAGLAQVWNLIAQEYNTIYGSILQVVGELNPVCLAASAASKSAAATCASITASVVAAAVTYFTGLPRTLPTSDQLKDLANGQLESVIEGAIESGASLVGVDCDDLTVSASDGDDIATVADKAGATTAQDALNDAREPDGSYSFCHGLAGALTNLVSSSYDSFDGKLMGDAMEAWIQPGMTVVPFADTPPTLLVFGRGSQSVVIGSTCPATVNMTVHLPGVGTYDPATKTTDFGPDLNWKLVPQTINLVAASGTGSTTWAGSLQVPLLPNLHDYDPSRVLTSTLNEAGDPYLTLAVDSPCFGTTLNIVATQYDTSSAPYAFIDDQRQGLYYH
ncbi:MAG TPA: DUF456 domain-containing protein, partial [Galbitalea sp.]